jgi:hypothetical protein
MRASPVLFCFLLACGGDGDESGPDGGAPGADAAGPGADAAADAAPAREPGVLAAMPGERVAIDGDQVLFWSEGALWQVGLDGADLHPLVSGEQEVAGFAFDGECVVWATPGTHANDFLDGRIRTMPRAGGSASTLVPDRTFPSDVALYGGRVSWSEIDGEHVASTDLEGGDLDEVVEVGYHESVAAGAFGLVWTDSGNSTGAVSARPAGSSDIKTLADRQANPRELLLDGDELFWLSHFRLGDQPASIVRADLATGRVEAVATARIDPGGLALDDAGVYVVDRAAGAILRAPRSGGPLESLVADQPGARFVAAGGGFLVWTTDGAVRILDLSTDTRR